MSDIDIKSEGKKDERLEYVLEICRKAVEVFVKAMDKMEYAMRFKAIELKYLKEEEVSSIADLLSTAVACELNKQAKDTLKEITYDCALEKIESEEGSYAYWLSARKEKPDWSKVPKVEELPIETIKEKELEGALKATEDKANEVLNYIV